ncbi:hypothetical protein [Rhizobium sp. 18055]|uniref:hypothetical protein n=1 Tax=Rhizobium sp. 18055 TaxID=2681403 RepID=UPI001358CAAF|nr:hypothetical protein [Rhizobium sp. 18055]
MTNRYTFRKWKAGTPTPEHFVLVKAFNTIRERETFLITSLPVMRQKHTSTVWENEDMARTGWRVLPYGFGRDPANGDMILFDREYRAICSISGAGVVRIIPADNREWLAVDKVRFYSDGTTPPRYPETRRLVVDLVTRYRLGGELKRRAMLQRHGRLPGPNARAERDRPEWEEVLAHLTDGKGWFGFDTATGETLRIRPPKTAGRDWKPRPVNADDIDGITSWLKTKRMKAGRRDIARMVDVIGAARPLVYHPN